MSRCGLSSGTPGWLRLRAATSARSSRVSKLAPRASLMSLVSRLGLSRGAMSRMVRAGLVTRMP